MLLGQWFSELCGVTVHLHADRGIVDAQKSVVSARDRIWHHPENLLGNDARIFDITPQIFETMDTGAKPDKRQCG